MELSKNILLDLLKEADLPISNPPPTCLEDVPPEHLREIIASVRTLYEWDSATNMAIAQGCSFQDIFDLSEPMLENPAVLYDYMTQVSAHTRHIPCDDPIFQKAIELGRMPDELLRFMLDDVTRVFPQIITDTPVVIEHKISPHPEIVCQIKVNDRFVGYLYVQCVHHPLSEGMLDFIQLLAQKLQILAQREQNGTMGVHLADGDAERLLAQITEGVVQDSAMIASALAAHGLPLEGEFLLYLISDPHHDLEILRSSLHCLPLEAKLFRCGDYLLILARFSGKNRSPQLLRQSLENHLVSWLDFSHLQCGISRTFSSMTELPKAYQQAQESYEVAALLHQQTNEVAVWAREFLPRGNLAHFEDYQFLILLHKCGAEYAAGFCEPFLLSLMEADRKNGTDVVKVFFGHLCLNRNTNETAARFHMHRNTIVYRLKRICEKYELDLDNEQTRHRIALSFAYLELFG